MRYIIATAVLFFGIAAANAGEMPAYKPFPEAQISGAQWESYRQQVYGAYGPSLRRFPSQNLEVLHSPDNVMHFAFTTPGHPAHPAWITRSAQTGTVDQIGYFAGKEEPFAKLFQAYLNLTNRTIDSVPDEPAAEQVAPADSDGHGA